MYFRLRILTFLLSVLSFSLSAQTTVSLEPLGQIVIPYNKLVDGTPVGGLSGLTYDAASDKFYVISDDRSEYTAARFYSFRLKLAESDSLKAGAIKWMGKTFLKASDGCPYEEDLIDPEGIALGPDSLMYISSEGDPRINAAPFINGYDSTGRLVHQLSIPEAYWSDKKAKNSWGVRNNLGFEGLAINPDDTKLYAALENALVQDGPAADSVNTSPSRMIVFDHSSGQVLHEYWYSVDPVNRFPGNNDGFSVNGLTDLLVLDNTGSLLVLEREYVQNQGNRIRLYQVSTECATDVKETESLQQSKQPLRPVNKWLVADLADYGITIDNFEGMAMGPKLSDGGRLLLMVSDNNFSSSQQTIFTAFKIHTD